MMARLTSRTLLYSVSFGLLLRVGEGERGLHPNFDVYDIPGRV